MFWNILNFLKPCLLKVYQYTGIPVYRNIFGRSSITSMAMQKTIFLPDMALKFKFI
jgi:hypothetical protein